MKLPLTYDVSLYQQALSILSPPQPIPISSSTLLSLVRSMVDLLIEQQIAVTMWVKLPPGGIWQEEIQRYHSSVSLAHTIYNCEMGKLDTGTRGHGDAGTADAATRGHGDAGNLDTATRGHGDAGNLDTATRGHGDAGNLDAGDCLNSLSASPPHPLTASSSTPSPPHPLTASSSTPSSKYHSLQLVPNQHLQREYFFLILSPQFSAVILAHRPPKKFRTKKITAKAREVAKGKITASLLAVTAFEERIIQPVLNGIKQVIPPELLPNVEADLQIPPIPEPVETLQVTSRLLAQQLQRQDEICRQISAERITKVQQQKQELLTNLQLKDEYLNHLCQELRTPLTHMKTALSLLNSPNLKPPQRQRYLQMLKNQCDQQNSLINGLLNLVQLDSSLEGTTLEPVRLSDIVPGVVSTYQPLAQEKGIMLAYILPSDLPPVLCVSTWLQQIVINLLHNSIKFTPNGGEVWVRSCIQGNYVQIELRDTGIGIAESDIPKIFQRFYRVRPLPIEDPGGAGLGLTMVQQLLLRCGGSISVKSKVGEGSTFTVLLSIAGE